jgi:hypothetical protein
MTLDASPGICTLGPRDSSKAGSAQRGLSCFHIPASGAGWNSLSTSIACALAAVSVSIKSKSTLTHSSAPSPR